MKKELWLILLMHVPIHMKVVALDEHIPLRIVSAFYARARE